MANKSASEIFESILSVSSGHAYDGVITGIQEDYVQVRLAGAARHIIQTTIADHIRKEVLSIGMYVKVGAQFDRASGRVGRYILTDILPQLNFGDYAGSGSVPAAPEISVSASCDSGEWTVKWSKVNNVLYYELYWSADSEGSGAALIKETQSTEATIAFDTATPPKVFFAVRAIAGVNQGALSVWMTDLGVVASGGLLAFGDNHEHGLIVPSGNYKGNRWRVKQGLIEMSWEADKGMVWRDATPTADPQLWPGDTTPVTIQDVVFQQILYDPTNHDVYVVGRWNVEGERGAIWRSSNEGYNWLQFNLQQAGEIEARPLWAALDLVNQWLLVTVWADGQLALQLWDISAAMDYDSITPQGPATIEEIEERSRCK